MKQGVELIFLVVALHLVQGLDESAEDGVVLGV